MCCMLMLPESETVTICVLKFGEELLMDVQVSALGAIVGLIVAIFLIFKKVPPVYALFSGALIGGLLGGATLVETVSLMNQGAQGIVTAVLRILSAGVLAGILIESGAASSIAQTIIKKLGHSKALFALALATMLLTAVGVFIDIAVITVAPIAMAIAYKTNMSRTAILLTMIGGGKAGNIISPNPNTIAVSEAFGVPLTNVMLAGVIPAVFAVVVTYFIAKRLVLKGSSISEKELSEETQSVPSFGKAIVAPLVAIVLLSLRPIAGIAIDPMIALPVGGIAGIVVMGKFSSITAYTISGLNKMSGVAVLLLGTGTLAGIISNSALGEVLISGIETMGLPAYMLAPISGIFMSAATASTTSGAAVASSVFSQTLLKAGISNIGGAAMVHAGATVLDHLPHGSFFHATAGSVTMDFRERLRLISYESLIGLIITVISTLIFGVFNLFG